MSNFWLSEGLYVFLIFLLSLSKHILQKSTLFSNPFIGHLYLNYKEKKTIASFFLHVFEQQLSINVRKYTLEMILLTHWFFRFQHTPDGHSKTLSFFENSQLNPKGKPTLRCHSKMRSKKVSIFWICFFGQF